jgi:hypothetical protein
MCVWDLSAVCGWAVRPSSCQGSKDASDSCKTLRVWAPGAWVVIALLGDFIHGAIAECYT